VTLGGHYDSRPFEGLAPGAVDNGSGAAAVLTIAKALADAKACGECLCGVEIRLVCCAFACLRLCAADAAMQWLREPMVDGP